MLFSFKLQGHTIYCDAIDIDKTYAGLYEGVPSKEMNDSIVERSITEVEKAWGKNRATKIIDNRELFKPPFSDKERLGGTRIKLWLNGPEFDPEDHGTELVVIMFCEYNANIPMAQFLEKQLHNVDWKSESRGFCY